MQNTFTRNLLRTTIRRCAQSAATPFPGCGRNGVSNSGMPKLCRPDGFAAQVQPPPQRTVSGNKAGRPRAANGSRGICGPELEKTILIVAVFGSAGSALDNRPSPACNGGYRRNWRDGILLFSKDKDMLGAGKAYAKLEQKLQRYLDTPTRPPTTMMNTIFI